MANNPHINKVTLGEEVLIDLTGDTVTPGSMLNGVAAHDKSGAAITGTIQSVVSQTFIPGTVDQVIEAGKYLSGEQIIKGDANLLAENIRKGKTIFGVAGAIDDAPPEMYDGEYTISVNE